MSRRKVEGETSLLMADGPRTTPIEVSWTLQGDEGLVTLRDPRNGAQVSLAPGMLPLLMAELAHAREKLGGAK